jgi:hypothetical protein
MTIKKPETMRTETEDYQDSPDYSRKVVIYRALIWGKMVERAND